MLINIKMLHFMKNTVNKMLFTTVAFLIGCHEKPIKKIDTKNEIKYLRVNLQKENNIENFVVECKNEKFSDSTYYFSILSNNVNNHFVFPIKKNNNSFFIRENLKGKLIGNKLYEFKQEKIIVYRYYYKDENASDSDEIIFFNPKIGILVKKSLNWGNYAIMVENNKKEDSSKILYLTQRIISDCNFFTYE